MTVRSALRALARVDAPGRRWVGPALATVCISVLLAGVGERTLPAYVAGEVADRDLVAPVEFSYVDVEATTARQDAAAEAVPPVVPIKEKEIPLLCIDACSLLIGEARRVVKSRLGK